MISNTVKINNVEVDVNNAIVAEKNRKGSVGYGSITVFSTRSERYEPYTVVDLTCGGKIFQYVVQADEPHQEKSDNYEHVITLAECILFFKTVFPADRGFTKAVPMTIAEIFAVYKRELSFYQGIEIELENNTDSIYATKMPWKEYASKNFAVIIYDLFRRIDCLPRVEWDWASSTWTFSREAFNEKGSEITVDHDAADTIVNDIDYATDIKGQARNALRESDPGIWFPGKNEYITPRAKGTLFRDTELQFQFPSPIITIKNAVCYVLCDMILVGDADYTEHYVKIDFTGSIFSKEEWEALPIYSDPNCNLHITYNYTTEVLEDPDAHYKQNSLYYEIGKSTIDNLFSQEQYIFFTTNVVTLNNAIYYWLLKSADEQYDINWAYGAPESPKVLPEGYANMDDMDTEAFKCNFLFTTQKDFDFKTEKADISNLVKTTVLNAQSENIIDASRYLESAYALANRLGHPVERREQMFNDTDTVWDLGDYDATLGTIIDIRYAYDRYAVIVTADFAIGFSNTSGEYSISKEPEAFTIGKIRQHTNPIYSEYLVFSKFNNPDDTIFNSEAKATIMNILDWESANNEPITHANMIPYPTDTSVFTGTGIDMHVFGAGSGNVIMLNVSFNHQTIAGYSKIKIDSAWYKNPVKYVYTDDSLEDAKILFQNGVTLLADTSTLEYYPLVNSIDAFINAKTSRIDFPIDKNPNDSFGLTMQIICVSHSPEDIVIGNAFTKYNNIIYEIDSAPDVRVYVSTDPFSVFDKRIRAGDVLDSGAVRTIGALYGGTFTVTLSEAYTGYNWAVTYGEEIMLAGNNETYSMYIDLLKERE